MTNTVHRQQVGLKPVQHIAVLNSVDNCNKTVFGNALRFVMTATTSLGDRNISASLQSYGNTYMQSVVNQNAVKWRMTVYNMDIK